MAGLIYKPNHVCAPLKFWIEGENNKLAVNLKQSPSFFSWCEYEIKQIEQQEQF
jgi:hypothetical protein